jgi:multicomponent Na+:H+ antiporter subunit A
MVSALLSIALTALLAPALYARLGARAGWVLALAPMGAFLWFLSCIPLIAGGGVVVASVAWVPMLGIEAALRLDGLSLLFSLLVSGIGVLVVLYAGAYLSTHHHAGRFHAYLLTFMLAMLGLVLADDLITMFVFWELTGVVSYLLICFSHESQTSRRAALQALLITNGGALALLAGLVLLGIAGGSWRFSGLDVAAVEAHGSYYIIMALVLAGCFTKSAQFPFHLWLPNAMSAPAPVSAFLHSATMVKAGVYLMARLNPVLGGEGGWGATLVAVGAVTAVAGAVLAIRQTDMKRLLAYTTVAVLGQLTMLIGTNTSYGLQAFVLLLLAHSLYKGALFMSAGAIDHATGTRELHLLGGLMRVMPMTGAAVALAALSNAGLPPFFGFIAKEFAYSGLIAMGVTGWLVTLVMIVTNALLLAAAAIVFIRVFLGRAGAYPRVPHEAPVLMWLGPLLLAAGGFALGVWYRWPEVWLVNAAVQVVARGTVDVNLYLWGGVTPAVVASFLTITLGVLFYHFRHPLRRHMARWRVLWAVSGDRVWDGLLRKLFGVAARVARAWQHGSLRLHLSLMVLVISVAALLTLAMSGESALREGQFAPLSMPGIAGCVLALLGAGAAAAMRGRLALVVALGSSGLGLALFFLSAHAPDVAMTQLMVETLTVVFLAFVFRAMPVLPDTGARRRPEKVLHVLISVLFGVAVATALIAAMSLPLEGDIARWYVDNSLERGNGANVVNVILVDFRAFDTLGEILVVALAALGAASLLGIGGPPAKVRQGEPEFDSVLIRHAMTPLAIVLVLVALALLWRGHNAPGGGFIGGLVAAIGCTLLALTYGRRHLHARMRVRPEALVGIGLGCALGAGLAGVVVDEPFLTGLWLFPAGIPLGTPLLFDAGVFLTVFGSVMHMLDRLTGRSG